MRRSALLVGAVAAALLLVAPLAASQAGTAPLPTRNPYGSLGTCPVFPTPPASLSPWAPSLPTQAAWNQDISRAPVARNSKATISFIQHHGADRLHAAFGSPREWGFTYGVVGADQASLPINYTAFGSQSDFGPFPIPANVPLEAWAGVNGDHHAIVFDRARCRLYELYRAFFSDNGDSHWNADAGVEWDLRSPERQPDGYTSADGAGLPIFPGLVRYDEVESGEIDHAIRVTFTTIRKAWIHPATHCFGQTSDAVAPSMGSRLRLRQDYNLRGIKGDARVIAVAMKRYGMIVADAGSNWYFSGTSDPRWSNRNLDQLKRIPGSAFQVVRSAATPHTC